MPTTEPKAADLPKWLTTLTKLLRSTRVRVLVRLSVRIEHGAVRATRKRFFVVLFAIFGFFVAVKPAVTAVNDGVNFLGKHLLGWGVCHELLPSATGFGRTKEKRACHPGDITAFKWKYQFDKDACDGCENRAFSLTRVEQSGRFRWVEFYMKTATAGAPQDWGAAHNWIVVDPQANRGYGSYSQGLLFRRQDEPALFDKDGRVKILEAFVPSQAGVGCSASPRKGACQPEENTLYFRWIILQPGESQVPEALYHKGAEPWAPQSPISSVARDAG